MRITLAILILAMASALSADSSHFFGGSGGAIGTENAFLEVNHTATPTSAEIVVTVNFSSQDSGEFWIRLIDHAGLFNEPFTINDDTYIKRETRSDNGMLQIIYNTPSHSGVKTYSIEMGASATNWSGNGQIAVVGADGEVRERGQIQGTRDVTWGGSFLRAAITEAVTESFYLDAQLTLRVDVGPVPNKLRMISALAATDMLSVSLYHRTGAETDNPQSVGDAIALIGPDTTPVEQDRVAGSGGTIDQASIYESENYFMGIVDLVFRFDHINNPTVDLTLLFPASTKVTNADTIYFYEYSPNSIPIGSSTLGYASGEGGSSCALAPASGSARWLWVLGVVSVVMVGRRRES